VDVKDTLSLKDETLEINLVNLPNPHVDGMVIVTWSARIWCG